MQQLAAGIGSAVVTSRAAAMQTALIVVLVATAACLPAVRLLPRRARAEGAGELAHA
ncbi:MAG TPA: hypothetical protein VI318_16045 [Baekduia sp.]